MAQRDVLLPTLGASVALLMAVPGLTGAAPAKSELEGAAVLDHACGKTALEQMGLMHAGNIIERYL